MRENNAKKKLCDGECTIGSWLSLCSPIAARWLARLPFDWLTVDIEHSPVGWETASAMLASVADSGVVPLVRVPAGTHDHIKRALDAGAFGVVVPMVMDRAHADACIAACKYPPVGNRSVGGALHALNFDTEPAEYFAKANDEILVVLQCEHIEAVERADEIFAAPGLDAVFVGPNDLKASMRTKGGAAPSSAAFEEALTRILEACQRNNVAAGLHCFSPADILRRRSAGWRFLALDSDLAFLSNGADAALSELGLKSRRTTAY